MFNEQTAWAAVYDGVKDVEQLTPHIRSQIVGITVAGSLVRGDFIENRSDVDIYTVFAGDAEKPWKSEAHQQTRACFDPHFAVYKGNSANPYVWDDTCISVDGLPGCDEDFASQRLKAMGIYFFDFARYHKTIWGEDFTRGMPDPVDPKPLVPARLDFLTTWVERIVREDPADKMRILHLAGSAVTALQVYFSDEPSINKFDVLRQYSHAVPDFPQKDLGLEVWNGYLHGDNIANSELPQPPEAYVSLLKGAKELVAKHR